VRFRWHLAGDHKGRPYERWFGHRSSLRLAVVIEAICLTTRSPPCAP